MDKLYIFDLSDSDKEHETNLHTIKELSRIMEIPIYGAGSIARLEDIKKLLPVSKNRKHILKRAE